MRHPDDAKLTSIMTRKLITVRPNESVRRAFFLMREQQVRHLLVTEDDGSLIGIVSDRDLRRPDWVDEDMGVSHPYLLDEDMEVDSVMTHDPVVLYTYDRISKAVDRFHKHRFGALPVLDKAEDLVGIVSIWDVLGLVKDMLNGRNGG